MGRPRKTAAGNTQNPRESIQGYIVREEKIAINEDDLFSEEDDDFDFASKSVKKVAIPKTKGSSKYPHSTLG